MLTINRRFGASATAMTLVFVTGLTVPFDRPANAQEDDITSEGDAVIGAADVNPGIDQIVVMSRRREEGIQSVPMSVTAFGAEDLAERSIVEIDDLAQFTPGLSMETAGATRPFVYIRGIGSGTFDAQSDPAVAFFIDEVYISRFSGMTFDLLDIERIEVLKGPQGTLYGRNAAGGAISITTAKPTDELSGSVRVEGGSFAAWHARASVSGPLIDGRLNGRLSVGGRGRNGYANDRFTGENIDDQLAWGARAQFEYFLAPNVRLLTTFDITQDRDGPWAQRNLTPNIFSVGPAALAGFPEPSSEFYEVDYSFVGFQDRDSHSITARFSWDFGPVEMIYLGNYRHAEFEEAQDDDSSVADAFDRFASEDTDQWSQELRFVSAGDRRFRWIIGLYYFSEETDRLDRWEFGPESASPIAPTTWDDRIFIETDSYAVFGEATFAVTDALDVTFGARYSYDAKTADRVVAIPPLPGYTLDGLSEDWDSFDPQITVDYQVSDALFLYATWRNGFKSGGFQSAVATSQLVAGTVFSPEDTRSFEFGFKSDWLGGRFRLNAAGFINTYTDLQVLQSIAVGPTGAPIVATLNAAEVDANGFEIEFVALPHPQLEITGGYAYTDATFAEFFDQTGADLSGNRNIRFPKHLVNLNAEYTVPLGSSRSLSFRSEWSWRDRQFFEFNNIESLSQDPYHLVNFRLAFSSADGNWRFFGYVENATDAEICQNVLAVAGNTIGLCTMDAPRRFGAGASWAF